MNIKKLIIIGALVHLLFFLVNHDRMPFIRVQDRNTDELQFDQEANNFLAGKGITSDETPGKPSTATYPSYVLAISIIRGIFRDQYNSVFLIQHAMVLLTAYIMYKYAKKSLFTERASLLAASIILFYPPFLKFSDLLVPTIFTTLCVSLGVFLLAGKLKYKQLIAAGIIWGVATLSRFTHQIVIPMYIILTLLKEAFNKQSNIRRVTLRMTVIALSFILVLAPWYIRLSRIEGQFTPGSTGAGMMFYRFNSPDFDYSMNSFRNDSLIVRLYRDSSITASQRDSTFKVRAIQNVIHYPKAFVTNCLENLPTIVTNIGKHRNPSIHSTYSGLLGMALLTFGTVGLMTLKKADFWYHRQIAIVIFAILLVHVPIYGHIAHGLPIWAIFAPFIGKGLDFVIHAIQSSKVDNESKK